MADSVSITPGVGDTIAADDIGGVKFQRVKLIHGADGTNDGDVSGANGLPVKIASSAGTLGVYLDSINQTINVRVQQVDGTVAVYFSQSEPTVKIKNETSGTIAVKFNSEPTVISSGKQGATTRPLIMNTDGAIKIYDIANGTVTVNGTVTANAGTGTLSVRFSDEPYVVTEGKYGATKIATIHNTDGALKIYDIAQGTVTVTGITNSIGVYVDSIRQTIGVRVGQIDGTVAVYFDKSGPTVNNSATMVVGSAGGSVSGQYVGISDLGITLMAPEANHNTKVYAFSIITTAQVQIVPKFTNGAGAATELWRVALQAPTQGISGVSQSIQPPGYLFATGINTTLALRLDSASLVHYSISYFKESA